MDSNADPPGFGCFITPKSDRRGHGHWSIAAFTGAALLVSISCGATEQVQNAQEPSNHGKSLDFVQRGSPVKGDDSWEVVLCQIPLNSSDENYAPIDQRLTVRASDIVLAINPITEYFDHWSRGRYSMTLVAGDPVTIDQDEDAHSCVEAALESSANTATGVIVIADAAHRGDVPGGWAQPGIGCPTPIDACAAKVSRRAVYLGAADFLPLTDPENVNSVALDLLEHELGHVLGWPHSVRQSQTTSNSSSVHGYDSVIDIMSNSAAARELNAQRQHGPGVLGLNLLTAGWLDLDEVMVIDPPPTTASSTAPAMYSLASIGATQKSDDPRLLLIDIGDNTAITIEFITNIGDNDHLVRPGVAVHRVEWGPDVCEIPGKENLCLGTARRVTLLGTSADGLLGVGESVTSDEIIVSITNLSSQSSDARAMISIGRR